ncbi:4-hydroxy-tetrahydrodipicolinate synthase [Pullulanibacillus sp. KACC 23026]|uniref:4-hydroxy-tetrahydrodipicolinate synthase n=1 Tax=Pullulanibacillus sp. KACC 23026 TaxID=3028315 RepID=UPI0023AF5971|nr:4-hydroxy-tetrahydrodipicolinate synthase [Pullulanibacillus sp. KACC 23026]WEG11569.1 4-hydroxy-tetrahydrodipicolinate synthase [Pullulanibacillus sp. KACC 23026]
MTFGRMLTAMVTPFDQEGHLDVTKIKGLVDHLINTGTEGLVVAGTTGESPTLSHEEKIELFKRVIDAAEGRVPVIAGTGSNNTNASINLTKEAETLGVDGIMLVAPYYSKPNQEGLYRHFEAIATSVHLPVMIYNIPGRSAVNISTDTIVRLAQIDNITCVKEASGDLDQMAQIIEKAPDDFILYTGDDGLTLPTLAIGGYGVVSVASHVIGRELSGLIQAFQEGRLSEAAAEHRRLLPLMRQLFVEPSPVPIKTLLNGLDIKVGGVRLPLVPLTDEARVDLQRVYDKVVEGAN